MRLSIERSQEGTGRAIFVVTCSGLEVGSEERQKLNRYGAPPLEELFDEGADLAQLETTGLRREFADARIAAAFIDKVRAACEETDHYWRKAVRFQGVEQYVSAPTKRSSARGGAHAQPTEPDDPR